MKINENNFISQLKAKDEKALVYVIDAYGWVIKSVIRKHLYHMKPCQEECMNDVLMAIWDNIQYYDPGKSSFQNWIAGIARYKSVDYLRRYLKDLNNQSWEEGMVKEEAGEQMELLEEELSEETESMLNCLKPRDRELFQRLFLEEQDIDTVSSETGMKKEVIYNRVSRGKKKLRKLFSIS